MKNTILMLLLCLGLSSCSKAQKTEFSPESLRTELLDTRQQTITFQNIISKHRGRTTVIEIWASWCSDCIKAMPEVKKLQDAHPEVDFVFISMDKSADKWQSGIERYALSGDHYWATDGMKGSFGNAIDLDWIPRYILLDKNGKILTYRAIEKDFKSMHTTLTQQK